MTTFNANLPEQENRLLRPDSTLARRHPYGYRVLINLGREGVGVQEVTQHDYHAVIRLSCGPVISVYRTGKVLVQGKLSWSVGIETKEAIERSLPQSTVWKMAYL